VYTPMSRHLSLEFEPRLLVGIGHQDRQIKLTRSEVANAEMTGGHVSEHTGGGPWYSPASPQSHVDSPQRL
jgi:hypothetical protein